MIDLFAFVLLVIALGLLFLGIGLVVTGWRGRDAAVWWRVQCGNLIYGYFGTEAELRTMLHQRHRGSWPDRVQVLRDGELADVDLRVQ